MTRHGVRHLKAYLTYFRSEMRYSGYGGITLEEQYHAVNISEPALFKLNFRERIT